ncbi:MULTISPECIES: hypothetical protein [unclassified Okeania]|nr:MULTISPECIES: hypothetical protein [unclassified Okeania]NET12692.1 hypothetical protein [Okeania sp. SIO1H6]NES75307.1 hypothetical protein [Okeania sp. SIO1H4]NES88231.1 hypothetical protein [Okeania sp. SIO2B9]NET19154.1 hypothetical protein [Okeania sp. SIO1H5]NET92506.1 hypothetical protein [Okeania sp. SIO1H2]
MIKIYRWFPSLKTDKINLRWAVIEQLALLLPTTVTAFGLSSASTWLKKETGDRRQETGGKLHGDSQRRAAPRLRSPK